MTYQTIFFLVLTRLSYRTSIYIALYADDVVILSESAVDFLRPLVLLVFIGLTMLLSNYKQ